MSNGEGKQFDLHDFISGVIPGSLMVVGLLPFLPQKIGIDSVGLVIPLLLFGYVAGRTVHEFSSSVERLLGLNTHRERFFQELTDPEAITQEAAAETRQFLSRTFSDLDLEEYDDEVTDSNREKYIRETCYGRVRSYLHIVGRGQSRKFKALCSFYRNMWMVSILLGFAYIMYGVAHFWSMDEIFAGSYIASFDLEVGVIYLIFIIISFSAVELFRRAKERSKKHYAQYLISDLLVHKNLDLATDRSDRHEARRDDSEREKLPEVEKNDQG